MVNRLDLISRSYLHQNQILHRSKEGFGGSGWKHTDAIIERATECGARTMLDYGAGECTLYKSFKKRGYKIKLHMYDPAVPKLASLPSPADMVVCTDVLEHVEPNYLANVMKHIHDLTIKGAYLVIASRPANKLLPNGENAHRIIEGAAFWKAQVEQFADWRIVQLSDIRKGGNPDGPNHEVRMWVVR